MDAHGEAGPLRHKKVLIAVRLVFGTLLASLAVHAFAHHRLHGAVPVILAAYLGTNLAMVWEKGASFGLQRIQGFLLIFDIAVLVVAMACLEQYREELFLAMFLVVLLASAGQRLAVSVAGFLAVAAFYAGFSLRSDDPDAAGHLAIGLPVLLVVAVYVGYVTEGIARERRQRSEMLARLHQELRGMNRIQSLAAGVLADLDAPRLFDGIAATAVDLLGAPFALVVWVGKDSEAPKAAVSRDVPPDLRERLRQGFGSEPLASVFRAPGVVRLGGAALSPLIPPGNRTGELLLSAIVDRAGGIQGILAIGFDSPHVHEEAEEQAAGLLVQQAALLLENATLYRMLAQTRDIWQSAFQSIPTPVVIVDGLGRIVQVNPAFLQLGEFDCVTVIGSSFAEAIAGAAFPNGRPALVPGEPVPAFDAARLSIPRLNGTFDVTRGPFFGATETGSGTVWVLRRLEEPA